MQIGDGFAEYVHFGKLSMVYLRRIYNNQTNLFSAIPSKTDYFGNSFFPYSVNQWNNLEPVIRSIVKISMFKKSLLKFIRPSQAYVYIVNYYVG